MAKRKRMHTLVISKAQKSEPSILQAIAGSEDLSESSINIVENYFARERYENLVEQGYDVTEKGFAKPKERVYGGWKETALRKPDWDMEECESKRVDYDPFEDHTHEQEDREDYMEAYSSNTELSFVESVSIVLAKAKIQRTYSQYFTQDNEFVSESVTLDVWNSDLGERRTFKIGSKKPITHSMKIAKMGEQPVITVSEGSISLARNKDRNQIELVIHGKRDVTLTFTVDGLIWMAEVVAKPEHAEVTELDLAL